MEGTIAAIVLLPLPPPTHTSALLHATNAARDDEFEATNLSGWEYNTCNESAGGWAGRLGGQAGRAGWAGSG